MGTMPPKELLTLWTRDDMPVEMAIGHILQNLAKMQATVEANHLKIRHLQTDLENLAGKNNLTQKVNRNYNPGKD